MIITDGYLKLLNIGFARKKIFSKTVVVTPNFISPEVLKDIDILFHVIIDH